MDLFKTVFLREKFNISLDLRVNFRVLNSQSEYWHISWSESLESFKYLGSILTNDGRCTCEIKCRIAMAKAAFNKKRTLFTSTLDLELRKKLVKCYIWSIALYGAEIGRFGQ